MSKWDVSFGDEAESDLRKLNTLARNYYHHYRPQNKDL